MDLGSLQGILTGVLTVTTIIASALVGILFGSLKTLRDTAGDLRNRVTDLEKERTEDKAKIAEEEAKTKILQAMVTGKVEWVALTDQLEEHHRQALVWWAKADGHLQVIPTAVHDAVEQALSAVVPALVAELSRNRPDAQQNS